MSIKVHLYSSLQNYTDHHDLVEVNGSTVGECLNDLVRQYPDLKPLLLDKNGKVLPTIFVSVNFSSPNPEQVERALTPGDELYIIQIVVGG
jgi:molybdopterin converting factor small subunit